MTQDSLLPRCWGFRGAIVAVAGLAFVARLGFMLWSPSEPSGDAFWYHHYAKAITAGWGYINPDGSPAVTWMPGWPTFLAGLYALFGADWRLGMLANALLGAASAVLLAWLGARLFRPGIGLAAATLYAVWPGNVYFAGTLMTETAFSFALLLCLAPLVHGVEASGRWRAPWMLGAGLGLGLAALIRPEPLVLVPVLLLFLAASLRRPRAVVAAGGLLLLATAVALSPWVLRNHSHFGRILVTSASGGANVWLGNHLGARGGQYLPDAIRFSKRHKRATLSESNFASNEAGWREAWAFVREHPDEEARILLRKLRLSYGSDAGAVQLLRGVGAHNWRYLDLETARRLTRIADAYWFAILSLAVLGLATVRSWTPAARVLVLGWLAAWLAVQLVFLGGARFHVAQTPALAILAALGLDVARRWLRERRAAIGDRASLSA